MSVRLRWLVLAVLAAPAARAQPAGDFATLDVYLGPAAQLASPYGGRWATEPGGVGRVVTPLLGGEAHVGLRAYPNDDASEALPDFLAVHAEAGWGPVVALPAGLRLVLAAHLGAVAFRFDDANQYTGALKNETELAAGFLLRLDAPVAGPLRAWAGADGVHVFTARPERMLFVEGGLSLLVATPPWLRRFLR